jgi:hypothetical protein
VTPNDVAAEIRSIIRRLIEAGLSNQQNHPSINRVGTRTDIGISGAPEIAISMKDQPYSEIYVDVNHPKSHLTLGQYPNRRIPVNAPISPARFMKFVLRNFYHTAFHAAQLDQIDSNYQFAETLTAKERAITYVSG